LDWPPNYNGAEPSPNDWAEHWTRCISEAAAADIVLLYARQDERQMGALIEAGAALAAGKRVFLVSDGELRFAHHPRCRRVATLAAAVEAIMNSHHCKETI